MARRSNNVVSGMRRKRIAVKGISFREPAARLPVHLYRRTARFAGYLVTQLIYRVTIRSAKQLLTDISHHDILRLQTRLPAGMASAGHGR